MNLDLNHIEYILILSIHLWVSYAIGCWFYDKFPRQTGETRFWKWFVISFAVFIPIYGPLGLVIIYLLLAGKVEMKEPGQMKFEEHLQHVRTHKEATRQLPEHNWKEIKEIQPIIEILKGNDVELQKGAIDTLSAKGDLQSVRMLKDALGYTYPEVRYFIVEALNKISKLYIDNIFAVKSALEHDQESAENLLKLAESYYDLAKSEVENLSLNHYFYGQADFYFSKVPRYRELENAEKKKHGNAFRKIGGQKEAMKVLNGLYPVQSIDIDEIPDLLDLYFQQANYKGLSEIAQLCRNSENSTFGELEKSISQWV